MVLIYQTCLEHIRIIRDGTPNQYMVLLKFRDEVSHLYDLFISIASKILLSTDIDYV